MQQAKKLNRYAFILPSAIIYLGVIVVPAFYSLYLSFFKWNGIAPIKKFVGFKNYSNLILYDQVFARAALNNVLWIALSMTITVSFALSIALLINRDFKGRVVFRGIFYFPYVLSGVIVAIIWTWIYHTQLGLLPGLLKLIGLGEIYKSPIANTKTALIGVYVAALWQGFGAPMILFLAGLKTIPLELYEAATIDGAHKVQTLFRITIPLLRETFVIVFATQIITSMKVFDIVRAMTDGGPAQRTQTMATWMVFQTFQLAKYGSGTAIAVIMVLVLMVVVIPFVLFMAKE